MQWRLPRARRPGWARASHPSTLSSKQLQEWVPPSARPRPLRCPRGPLVPPSRPLLPSPAWSPRWPLAKAWPPARSLGLHPWWVLARPCPFPSLGRHAIEREPLARLRGIQGVGCSRGAVVPGGQRLLRSPQAPGHSGVTGQSPGTLQGQRVHPGGSQVALWVHSAEEGTFIPLWVPAPSQDSSSQEAV